MTSLVEGLAYRRRGLFSRVVKELLSVWGVEIPAEVEIGKDLRLPHRAVGTVIHPRTRVGNRVTIYQGVTIGRSDAWLNAEQGARGSVVIEDDVVICPGAVVLFGNRPLRIGRGTIVGANAVLLSSTAPNEIWAGVPARKVGERGRDGTSKLSVVKPT